MTLHEAMRNILHEKSRPMNTKELADIINKRGLYYRGDRQPIPPGQVSARAHNYQYLFRKIPGSPMLITLM